MGCDIHLVIEVPDEQETPAKDHDGAWKFVHGFPYLERTMFANMPANEDGAYSAWFTARSRNYEFFAALAGVRGDGPAAKGLPPRLNGPTQQLVEDWSADGHSHTWYYGYEFAAIWGTLASSKAEYTAARLSGEEEKHGPATYEKHAGYTDAYHIWCGRKLLGSDIDCRVIIWFDN